MSYYNRLIRENQYRGLLEVDNLDVSFLLRRGELHAVNGITFSVRKGEIMGLVGESGSGKSVEAYAIMGLLEPPARINAGSVFFEGKDVLAMTEKEYESFSNTRTLVV